MSPISTAAVVAPPVPQESSECVGGAPREGTRRLRVLHVLPSRAPGGAEALVRDMSIELARRGHSPAIAFISRAKDLGNSVEFEAWFQSRLEAEGVPALDLGHHGKVNSAYGAWRLLRAVHAFRPDILHIHLQSALLFRLLVARLLPRRTVVLYTHHTNSLRFGSRVFRLLIRSVDGLVAISEQTSALLAPHARQPVAVIPNTVARPIIDNRLPPGKDGLFRVISVGRIFREKDYPTLVETVCALFRIRPNLRERIVFSVIGDGPERAKIEALIRERGLDGRIELLGTRTDAFDLMIDADLLLMTSIQEGLSIALLEALHAALPIVATDVGGCAEVVRHGINGFLATAGDAEQLARHILQILDDPALAGRFQDESRKLAAEYGIAGSVESHLRFYGELIRAKRV